tara:strand:- start:13 stop:597 length:585 start_codon:yes stop_codon:yes gene_type:complete
MTNFDASQSFIPAAAASLPERSGKKAKLAKYIDNFEGDFEDRVYQAFAQSFDEDSYYPIQILGYVQDLMDKVCWNARRVLKSYHLPEEVYGCDPTEKAREETGVSVDIEHIPDVVDADFNTLYVMAANMLQCAEGLDFELHYFNPSEVVDDEWVEQRTCDSFSDAQVEMDDIVDKLNTVNPVDALAAMRKRAAA